MFKFYHFFALAALLIPTALSAEDAPIIDTDFVEIDTGITIETEIIIANGETHILGGISPVVVEGVDGVDDGFDSSAIAGIIESLGVGVSPENLSIGVFDSEGNEISAYRSGKENALKGLSSPEIQQRIRDSLNRQMPKIQALMAQDKAKDLADLKDKIDLTPEEFSAIQPMIERVEKLKSQRAMIDPIVNDSDTSKMNRGLFSGSHLFTDDATLEPTVKALDEALTGLKTANSAAPTNETNILSAMALVRTARDAFTKELTTTQEALRSVLLEKQEAVLVVRGTLD